MRKVQKGRFVDFMPPLGDDTGMIGEHLYTNHAINESLKTAGYNYYIKNNDGSIETIQNATPLEKLVANILFLFNREKKKVLGARTLNAYNEKPYDPYDTPTPQLGMEVDRNGNPKIDRSYYDKRKKPKN